MKSEKGITLTSLVIYVISIAIIMSIVATITVYFNKNIKEIRSNANNSNTITRVNEYMLNDVKNSTSADISQDGKTLTFNLKNGNQIKYYIKTKGIYREKVKLCSNIDNTTNFQKEEIYNNTKIILQLNLKDVNQQKTLEYVITN